MSERLRSVVTLLVPLLGVVALDQWTKYIVRTRPSLHRLTLIDGWFDFTYIRNPGMALGIDWFDTRLVGIISIVATVAILAVTLRYMDRSTKPYLAAMGLILGGSVGNLIDRIFFAVMEGTGGWLEGHVVDFLHFTLQIGDFSVFPYIFNVADMFITCTVAVLIVFHKKLLPETAPD